MDGWLNLLTGRPEKIYAPFPNDEMQRQALAAFKRMGSREYDYLVEQLATETTNANIGITVAFKLAGTNAAPEIPKLIALFKRDEIVWAAIRCLVDIGTNSIPPLMHALSDKDIKIRQGAANALGQIGPPAGVAVPLLLNKLKTEKTQVRCSIIASLGLINQYPEKVVPVLIQNLESDDVNIRGNTAFALIGFSRNTDAAAPGLFKLLKDSDENVRNNAAGAIMNMKLGKEYIPLLATNASNPDAKVRSLIAQALGNQGAYTNEVFPILLKLTKDPDRYVRESAGVTINQMGYKPPVDVVKLRGLYQ